MKKLLLVAALVLGLACPALAKVQTFTRASVDVPSGWIASEQDGAIMLLSPTQEEILIVYIDDMDGNDLKTIAQAIASEMEVKEVKKTDNGYTFMTEDEPVSMTLVTQRGSEYFALTLIGEMTPEIQKVLDSVKSKKAK